VRILRLPVRARRNSGSRARFLVRGFSFADTGSHARLRRDDARAHMNAGPDPVRRVRPPSR
jgi:hypothetical protein